MSILIPRPLSRRDVVAGMFSLVALSRSSRVASNQAERPAPVELGHGLEIRDYRLFPTQNVMRFIVEVHNTGDTPVDSPTLGVVLPHLEGSNYGWANPFGSVIPPHCSQGLLGLAPRGLSSDDQWGEPNWILCDDARTENAKLMQEWDAGISWDYQILEPLDAASQVNIANYGSISIERASVYGLVWDKSGRLCGSSGTYSIPTLAVGRTRELWIHIEPQQGNASNPFAIIDSVEQTEIEFRFQPVGKGINEGCQAVMT